MIKNLSALKFLSLLISIGLFIYPDAEAQLIGTPSTETVGTQHFKEYNGLVKQELGSFFTNNKDSFNLGADDSLSEFVSHVTADGKFNRLYRHYYKGIPVVNSQLILIGEYNVVHYVNGLVIGGLDINTSILTNKYSVYETARDYIGSNFTYSDDDSLLNYELDSMGISFEDYVSSTLSLEIIYKGTGTLTANNYALCYKVYLEYRDSLGSVYNNNVYVDAISGNVVRVMNAVSNSFETYGKVNTWYNGNDRGFNTRHCTLCSKYWLHDNRRGIFTNNFTRSKIGDWEKKGDLLDGDNNWTGEVERTAATSHWAVQQSFNYYLQRFYRRGFMNSGLRPIWVRINAVKSKYRYADFSMGNGADVIRIGNDDITNPIHKFKSAAHLDVLGHEFTHGIVQYMTGLGNDSNFADANALGEGFADIFGNLVELYATGTTDWAIKIGNIERYISDPFLDNNNPDPGITLPYHSPKSFLGSNHVRSFANRHADGGIIRYWFHLISQGGTYNGYTINSLGIAKAESIAYVAMNWWLWFSVDYPTAAKQIVESVKAHYGACSNEYIQVVKAFKAVNLLQPTDYNCYSGGRLIPMFNKTIPPTIDVTNPPIWVAKLAPVDDNPHYYGVHKNYTWIYPTSWTVSTNNDTFKLLGSTDSNSAYLKVLYSDDNGNNYADSAVVHFGNMDWSPTYHDTTGSFFVNAEGDETNYLDQEENGMISIFPNPNNGKFKVQLHYKIGNVKYELINSFGNIVQSGVVEESTFEVGHKNISNGIYILKVIVDNKTFVRKVSIVN